MKKTLLVASAVFAAFTVSAQCTDVFISEYVEGSGNDKGVELYNPTGSPISLDGYSLDRYSNGAATPSGGVLDLSGNTIPAYSAFVIVNGQTTVQNGGTSPAVSPAMQALADLLDGPYPAPCYFNGNDALVLTKNNGTAIVDIFGKVGEDPGTAWTDDPTAGYTDANGGTWWTRDQTLIRKPDVEQGVTDVAISEFNVTLEYDSLPNNTWDSLGTHTCTCALVGVEEQQISSARAYVFPNPSQDGIVWVRTTENLNAIEVMDVTGKIVYSQTVTGSIRRKKLDISNNPSGIYLIRSTFADGSAATNRVILR